jgi:hypothetical protein
MTAHVAVHAAMINALKATGVIVRLEPGEWMGVVKRQDAPLVVVARGGVFKKHFRYLTSYRGLAFYTQSDAQLVLPGRVELVQARSITIPEV